MSEENTNNEDTNPGSGSGTSTDVVSRSEFEKVLAAATKANAALEKIESDRKAAEDKAKADKAAAEGKAAEELAKTQGVLDTLSKRIKDYQERDQKAADAIFGKLPETVQKRVSLLKDKFPDPGEWLTYLQAEQSMAASDTDSSDDTDTTIRRGNDNERVPRKKYKIANRDYLEDKFGLDLENSHIEQADFDVDSTGNRRWSFPIRTFLKKLNKAGGAKMTRETAAGRMAKG